LNSELARAGEDATEFLDQLLYGAAKAAASDIHLAPNVRGLNVTIRVDGQLIDLAVLPGDTGRLVVNRIKVLAALRLETRAMAQDGRISRAVAGLSLDVRVSVLPTNLGERVVLRLVPSQGKYASLSELGLGPELANAFEQLLDRPQGIIFVTGPVGSGKSTTLYSALAHIHQTRGERTALVTLEDPIEQRLDFLTQTPVNLRGGITFAGSLRSVLRQDPNVLMLGEIRDRETAEVATQAGLTGHLILTTVHANDAIGAFTRLLELGVSAYALGSASLGSLSQRLVRTLCPVCKRIALPSSVQTRRIAELGGVLPEAHYFDAQGCEQCGNQGYLGRHPIAELVTVSAEVRTAIADGLPNASLEAIRAQPFAGLLRAGLARAAAGETTLSEVLRVCA
jgi:general secretion pathway protein E